MTLASAPGAGTALGLCLLLGFALLSPRTRGADGVVHLGPSGHATYLAIEGSGDDDWFVESSPDLVRWTTETSLGPLRSRRSDPPRRDLPADLAASRFFRARKTAGLYDPAVLRTISLTFTQANWQSLLTSNYSRGANLVATLCTLDNGSTNHNVGVRYKGNTSYSRGGTKKSVNIELDTTDPGADLMGYRTLNLNNAAGDETILREPIYFTVLQNYAPGPKGNLATLYINGAYWGVYSFAQQENSDLIREWFPSTDGDRWRAPNIGGGGGPGGAPGGGGGFSGAASALSWLGAAESLYKSKYELKTDNSTNAWTRLVHCIDVLNNTPAAEFPDRVEDVLAVDSWLWFLAVENIFADDDSYFNKGADYGFYYEPESGRMHPIEHDGNEAFTAGDVSLSPVQGSTGTNRPVIRQLLAVPELRQRYLAHLRTVLAESFNPTTLNPVIDAYVALSHDRLVADAKKNFTMAAYTNDLAALRTFIRSRNSFLTNHAELKPLSPAILAVSTPDPLPSAADSPWVTAHVAAAGANGIHSVWLYHRGKPYGRFARVQMLDDGLHDDGVANNGLFGAAIPPYPAGTKVRYYVEARSANAARTAAFSPARAEQVTLAYRVAINHAAHSPVVINEVMASNTTTLADPQGEFDDWIELRNVTDQSVDLTGRHLSDEPGNPRKWQFPDGTVIPANGHLLVWADEDGQATGGLHASFKLNAAGEDLFLTDTDANQNAILDSISFPALATDRSYGRSAVDADTWLIQAPSPNRENP